MCVLDWKTFDHYWLFFFRYRAVGLTFSHPITGEEMNFSIPEPAKFE